ncbi:MAG: hypothetical protein GY765_03200 [bacterium]|nr:hypothetical protein [bacterium]
MTAKRVLLGVLVIFCFTSLAVAEDAFSVVANKASAVDSFNARELKSIFLGKKTSWPDGKKIMVVVLKTGDVHKAFLKAIVKKNPKQYALFWKKATFTGTGEPPKMVKTEAELVAFVKSTAGAIGYVSAAGADTSVKKIAIK